MKFNEFTKAAFKLVATVFCFELLMRLAFYFIFSGRAGEYTQIEILKATYLGMKFDLRIALFFAIPFMLLKYLINPVKFKNFWIYFHTLLFFGFVIGFCLDIGYYSYLGGRINGTALRFLHNFFISTQMVWSSYPIVRIGLFVFAVTFAFYFILRRYIFNFSYPLRPTRKSIYHKVLLKFTIFAVVVFGLYGKFARYPLRWSEAFFSTNSFVSNFALNPWHYFADTFNADKSTFDAELTKKYYDNISSYLKVTDPDKDTLNFRRPLDQTPLLPKNTNVIMIVMESMGAYKTGVLNNPINPTPRFDEIANQSHLYTKFFVPSQGTARSMFTLVSSVSDVTNYRTSSRNPLIVNQNTFINSFKDYEKYYFLGGSANWGEIRGVLTNNIKDLKVYEEGSYESANTDVWGLSDLDLFKEAAKALKTRDSKKPFFALIQASSFHRPYTIPEARDDFKLLNLPKDQVEKAGFISIKEFNSIRFADYSLGVFFDRIKNEPFFENTVIAIIGDHGLPANGSEHLNKAYKQFDLARFHVPLAIYAPKHLKPKKIDTVATEPDVLPTLAALTGHTHTNKSMGRNLYSKNYDKRYALMYVYYTTPREIMLINDKYLVHGNRETGMTGLYDYTLDELSPNMADQNPELFKELSDHAMGLFETSKYMLYNNSKE
ncbi:sulfatase-like hydrolase/transferase [bacterium]|nr:sulfatase-like hydrolase/transferase [bacterium]